MPLPPNLMGKRKPRAKRRNSAVLSAPRTTHRHLGQRRTKRIGSDVTHAKRGSTGAAWARATIWKAWTNGAPGNALGARDMCLVESHLVLSLQVLQPLFGAGQDAGYHHEAPRAQVVAEADDPRLCEHALGRPVRCHEVAPHARREEDPAR